MIFLITISAVALQIAALLSLKSNNTITEKPSRKLLALGCLAISTVLLCVEYGTLAGIIISLVLISAVGVSLPFLVSDRRAEEG